MSRFFRSGQSDSSDSGTSESSDGESQQDLLRRSSDAAGRALVPRPNTDSRKDVLLHALLEERCRVQVRQEAKANGVPLGEEEIQAQASRRYQSLSAELARLGVVDTGSGTHTDAHAPTREQVLRGLDALARGTKVSTVPSRLLIGAAPASAGDSTVEVASGRREQSRYKNDFEEIDVIGKGGYGVVYACRHRLDNTIYAVKKIPLPASRDVITRDRVARDPVNKGPIQKRKITGDRLSTHLLPESASLAQSEEIISRAPSEIDTLLNEVRMLARLDHPNVVRYHSGWIDWTNLDTPGTLVQPGFAPGADDTGITAGNSLRRIVTNSDTDDSRITFENSCRGQGNAPCVPHLLHQSSLQALAVDVTEGTESLSRDSSSQGIATGTNGLVYNTAKPCLALHIQMALYPMNLSAFLAPPDHITDADQSVSLSHCFHLQPSIRILLALLDGVEYLHRCDVVHRDLKPGNVFLEACSDAHSRGTTDLFDCSSCLESMENLTDVDVTSGTPRADTFRRIRVRIGDFGLATLRTAEDSSIASSPLDVGTALYQPTTIQSPHSPHLDIYALGIIAFELVWPFATRMERHATLSRLKLGEFPAEFDARVGDVDGKMRECIRDMITLEGVGLADIRRQLEGKLR